MRRSWPKHPREKTRTVRDRKVVGWRMLQISIDIVKYRADRNVGI